MKELQIHLNHSTSTESNEIKDALNTVLLDVKHDLQNKKIKTTLVVEQTDNVSLFINNENINLSCEWQEIKDACHCSLEDIIRTQILKQAGISNLCVCGGNCGCH